jgi:hypothetical protein
MAQHDYNIANQTFPSFRSDLNNALSAIQTNNSGTSRPTGAVAGQIWLDTTNATSPTLKFYDGADDISLATINYTTNTVDWLDSSITITGLSTTATGTVLTLSDTANTTSVNLIIDNQKEVRFRETTANGTNYIALKAPASVASDLTFTLPATDGASGQALVTNGSGVLSFASAGVSWQSVQTTGFTAVAGRGYPCNTTSSAFTVTLPASPSAGDEVIILDYAGTADTNNITVSPNGNKIEGQTNGLLITGDREGVRLVYIDSTQGWIGVSGFQEGTDAMIPSTYSIDFLVVAGGGAGGSTQAGGGGAGGFRTSTQTVNQGTVITVTVGDGAASNGNTFGDAGSNSSISGSGLTTITSAGGGGGAGGNSGSRPTAGGSGGGGSGPGVPNAGFGNTPSTSPSQGNNGGDGGGQPAVCVYGGAGGGAGAVGGAANISPSAPACGNGGNGTASSITGSSVTYAGGGGGGSDNRASPSTTGGDGGTGGGGTGGRSGNSYTPTAGTVNLGGGGGGGSYVAPPGSSTNGAAGGKGVVILSLPTAKYSSTSTGSPTVTTSGSNTILKFTGSGSYTA